jgi:hypothetical protein
VSRKRQVTLPVRELRSADALFAATAELQPGAGALLTGDQAIARLKDLHCHARLLDAD